VNGVAVVEPVAETPAAPPAMDVAALPPLPRDRSFWGMTATQFLGAFNDNLYKQLVLLICLDYVALRQLDHDPYQAYAQGLFSLPFILFSGFAGWLSDRYSKRTIVVLCKLAEIGVMGAGLAVFAAFRFGSDAYLWGLLAVLFLMGTHSAFFGPAKYGILPEMLRESDLPLANGIVQMTTFLAIIFGTALCGVLKHGLNDAPQNLWQVSLVCVGIACVGTLTSILVRRTPIAEPGLPFHIEGLAIDKSTLVMLKFDRTLRNALFATVLFWFLGGVAMPTVNSFGKEQLGLGDRFTSALTACIGLGIAFGCAAAGLASRRRIRFGLVRLGAWGMLAAFVFLGSLPWWMDAAPHHPTLADVKQAKGGLDLSQREQLVGMLSAGGLMLMGLSAGLYAVPLQTLLQSRPPRQQKGRMIAAMNICTWLGILASAACYGLCSAIFTPQRISATFYVLAAMILPLALLYRPASEPLGQSVE
jgi:MFS family permease